MSRREGVGVLLGPGADQSVKVVMDALGHILRAGEALQGQTIEAEIVSPHMYDPAGDRQHG